MNPSPIETISTESQRKDKKINDKRSVDEVKKVCIHDAGKNAKKGARQCIHCGQNVWVH